MYPGSFFSNTLWTSEANMTMQCQSFDPGWIQLLGGDSFFTLVCDHPSTNGGWNNTADTSGRCRVDFLRYSSSSSVLEELFTCDVSQCNSRAFLPFNDQSSSYFAVGQSSVTYREPSGAIALRLLLVIFSIIAGGVALLPFRYKDPAMLTLLTITLFLLVMNVSEGAKLNVDGNKANRSIASFTSATDPNVVLQCQKTSCYCNPTAVGKPNCNGEMGTVVNSLKNAAKFTCNNITKQCVFNHDDLFGGTFNIFMSCEPTNCVKSWPPPVTDISGSLVTKDNTAAVVVGSFAAFFAFVVLASAVLHFVRSAKGQRAWEQYAAAHAQSSLGESSPRFPPLAHADASPTIVRDTSDPSALKTSPDGGRSKLHSTMTSANIIVSSISYEVRPSRFDSFDSLLYPKPSRVIVKDVSLRLAAGKMVAIMGPSGCGKTTLLDALCQREKMGDLSGDILIELRRHTRNHYNSSTPSSDSCSSVRIGPQNSTTFRHLLGYVADDDVILPTLTVYEALEYAAALRQPIFIPHADKQQFLNHLIRVFRLESCRDTVIGRVTSDDARGFLSQGERRRVAIAQHLVSLPRVLVLDEPTTGLDSYNARLVVQCLRDVARISDDSIYAGYYSSFYNYAPLILMTIHQPTNDMYASFDEVCIMSQGRCIFYGAAEAAVPWFRASRVVDSTAMGKIAAPDLILEVASTLSESQLDVLANAVRELAMQSPKMRLPEPDGSSSAEAAEAGATLSAGGCVGDMSLPQEDVDFNSSVEREDDPEELIRLPPTTEKSACDGIEDSPGTNDEVSQRGEDRNGSNTLTLRTLRRIEAQKSLFYPQFWTQVRILTRRGWRHIVHDGRILALHFLVSTVITFIASFLYQNSGMDVPGTLSKAGAITFYLLWLAVINLSALDLFLSERGTYIFETSSAAYSAGAYYTAKLVLDSLLLRIIPTTIGGLLMYFQIGLRTDADALGYFLVVTILFSLVCSGLCTTIACLVPNFGVGILFNGFLIIFLFAFGGFMSQTSVMPVGLQWIRYVSPFYYGFEAIVVNQLVGQTCFFSALDPTGLATTLPLPLACEQYIFNLGLKPTNFSFDLAMLGMWTGIYMITSFLSLKFLVRGKR